MQSSIKAHLIIRRHYNWKIHQTFYIFFVCLWIRFILFFIFCLSLLALISFFLFFSMQPIIYFFVVESTILNAKKKSQNILLSRWMNQIVIHLEVDNIAYLNLMVQRLKEFHQNWCVYFVLFRCFRHHSSKRTSNFVNLLSSVLCVIGFNQIFILHWIYRNDFGKSIICQMCPNN